MSVKHTPGPWVAGTTVVFGPDDEDGHVTHIAAVASHRDEASFNAAVIAAAPDLLEALELVVGTLGFDREDDFNKEVLRRINAAIAKARGEP